jgi:acyl-CoA synthetase (NDP forming)
MNATLEPQQTERPSLDPLFRPASIAVVGASPDLQKPGGRVLAFLRKFGFGGELYAINPKYDEIDGVPCFASLDAAPSGIDLIVLLVPASDVAGAIRAAAARGTRAAIVCSSGFSEAGADGAALEAELTRTAAETGVAVLGPNSLGLLDLNGSLAATFSTSLQLDVAPAIGPVALISQSGAMGAAIFGLAQSEGVPVGTFVSTGNEAALGFADYVRYLADSSDLRVILGYIEGVRDGRRLVEAARYARDRGKVVAVLKAGRTDAGASAARSHTGALTGSAAVYDAAFRRAGILEARSPRELLDIAIAFVGGRTSVGDGVGIVSMSGGAGAIMSDRVAERGLNVTTLASETVTRLRDVLPAFTTIGNPVDYGGIYTDSDKIERASRIVLADPQVHALLFFIGLSPLMLGDLDVRLERLLSETDRPIVAAWLGGPPDGVATLRRCGIPAYEDPIRAADAIAALRGGSEPLRPEPEPEKRREPAWPAAAEGELNERETKRLLASYGIPVVDEALARTPEEAAELAERFGGRVAVKVEADGLLHKSDSGAVRLGVSTSDAPNAFLEVVAAARAAGAAVVHGAVVQPMARTGIELIAGLKHDPQFGPVVVVGLGGVASEAIRDVIVELAPLTHAHARAMLERLRGAALLGAFRGSKPRDVDAVAELLVALGRLGADAGARLSELDCNPVVVYPDGEGCIVLDAVAVLSEEENAHT